MVLHDPVYLKAMFLRRRDPADFVPIPALERRCRIRMGGRRLRQAAELCGWTHSGLILPIYPQIVAFREHLANLIHRDFPYNPRGVVQVRNHLEIYDLPLAGETCDLMARIENPVQAKRGMEFDLVTVLERGGRVLSVARATMLKRLRIRTAPKAAGDKQGDKPGPASPDGTVTRQDMTVTKDRVRRFAAVSGDYNPIHVWDLAARKFGFSGVIAHGQWSVSWLAAVAGADLCRPGMRFTAGFVSPIVVPAHVVAETWRRGDALVLRLVSHNGAEVHVNGEVVPLG